MDLNNNEPNIALLNNIMPINSFSPLKTNQQLFTNINENEVGPIVFDTAKMPPLVESKYYIAYDPDLGENGAFDLNLMQSLDTSDALIYPVKELKNKLMSNPFGNDTILNKNTVNLIIKDSFDFESLNLNATLDSNTRIGIKLVKFGVIN